ncbi:MAG: hypothetical protein ACOC8P_00505 [Dichotomicrobium sp.]
MVPVVLDQDTLGAPPLTGEAGSGYNVIKWVAQELGWEIAFDDEAASKIAIRSNPAKGPGRYYRFRDDPAAHGADARRIAVESFSDMSDIDIGTDGYPDQDQYWYKSVSLDATPREWMVIGTDHHLWFFAQPTGHADRMYRVFYAGDYVSYQVNDVSPAIILSSPITSTSSTQAWGGVSHIAFSETSTLQTSDVRTLFEQALASNYLNDQIGVDAHPVTQSPNVSADRAAPGSRGQNPDPITEAINVSRIEIAEASAGKARRGQLVGILNPLADLRVGSQTDYETGDLIDGISNGRDAVKVKFIATNGSFDNESNSNHHGAVLVDIESDWDNW